MIMKKILILFAMLPSVMFLSCRDEVDVEGLLSFPPGILLVEPGASSNVVLGNFDLKAVFIDGENSPLASASIILKDEQDNEITKATKNLSGVKDSIVVEGTSFNAVNLGEGSYKMLVEAKDVNDKTTSMTVAFKLVNSLYASVQTEMYISGVFNGWASTPLELVANHMWEVKEIDLQGTGWKLKNREDWSDTDWGDTNCDGIMDVTSGGGANTECEYAGLVNLRFNDQTLEYTVRPSVDYQSNVDNLYLMGTFNDFEGSVPKLALVADNTWELPEARLKPGDKFKFSEGPNFSGNNYGDNEQDGVADLFGSNIVMAEDAEDAFYKIVFNDQTLAYTLELVRYPYPDNLYLVGGSTVAGWDPSASVAFMKTDEGKFEIYSYLTSGDGFKFLEVRDWAGDWGKGEDGELIQEDEENLSVPEDGFYRIQADFINFNYSIQKMNWGVVGNATPGGWDNDTNLTFIGGKGDYIWSAEMPLTEGELKFRANGNWDVNLGDDDSDGLMEYSGANIIVGKAGDYTVELNLNPEGYSYSITEK